MNMYPLSLNNLERLRALRLWHWRQLQAAMSPDNHGAANKSFHLIAVMTLNNFFPTGDDAEEDDTKPAKLLTEIG